MKKFKLFALSIVACIGVFLGATGAYAFNPQPDPPGREEGF